MEIVDYFLSKIEKYNQKKVEKFKRERIFYKYNVTYNPFDTDKNIQYRGTINKDKNSFDKTKNYIILGINKFSNDGIILLDLKALQNKTNFTDCLIEIENKTPIYLEDGTLCTKGFNFYRDFASQAELTDKGLVVKQNENAFDRAKKCSKLLKMYTNKNAPTSELYLLHHIYDFSYILISEEILKHCSSAEDIFKMKITLELESDIYHNKMPLNQYISKWESWTKNNTKLEKSKQKEQTKQEKSQELLKRHIEKKDQQIKNEHCKQIKL